MVLNVIEEVEGQVHLMRRHFEAIVFFTQSLPI